MFRTKSNATIAFSLLLAIVLWGGNNTGTKFMVATWPPVWTASTRFLLAGVLMLALIRWTPWFGARERLSPELNRRLWLRGGLSLAIYLICFNWALRYTSASHMALYLGASPVWALLWEGRPGKTWLTVQRYGAALLALTGVCVLLWPALGRGQGDWRGEVLALIGSVLWTNYGRQSRRLGAEISGVTVTAHTMWRAGLLLLPIAAVEVIRGGIVWRTDLVWVQVYCVIAGGVIAFGIWNNALRQWPTSQVLLFNNLIPLSTMTWARLCLGEAVTRTFWIAMVLIVAGVVLGQLKWQKPR
jgi:drug/metabolite transporter (DMT)-like permease